jgi:Zn-dependent protease with chaperone function
MERKNYNKLIKKLKTFAQENPIGYKNRVVLLGFLGYGYIFLILTILIVLISGTILLIYHVHSGFAAGIKLLIFLGFLAFLIIKSLWVKISPPRGIKITKNETPELFKIIEDIVVKQNSIMPNTVLLNNDFNAFISQVPRLGILGWYKNYLVLGLPYMASCTVDQFKAVLAHEFGHFSGSHGRTGTWIYRIRASWYNILLNIENKTGDFIFRWFFNWYVPYFNAYSFVLARQYEYEADRSASDYAGAQANAEELVNSIIKANATKDFWTEMWALVNHQPEPPGNVFSKVLPLLKQTVSQEIYLDHLKKSLQIRTHNQDTHPSLNDRLKAIGYEFKNDQIVNKKGEALVLQRNLDKSAAEELLGESFVQSTVIKMDKEWADDFKKDWNQRHQDILKMKEELITYDQKINQGTITNDERLNRAYIIDQISSREETLKAIQDLLFHHPSCAPAHFRLGEILLENNNDQGVEHLKKAMGLNPGYQSTVLEKIAWYHETRGEYDSVEKIHEDLDVAVKKDQEAYKERNHVTPNDNFVEHRLSPETLANILSQLMPFEKELKNVYLAQKILMVYPENPLYVMAVTGKPKGFYWDSQTFNQQLLKKLFENITFKNTDGMIYFIVGDSSMIQKFKKIPNALIFKR